MGLPGCTSAAQPPRVGAAARGRYKGWNSTMLGGLKPHLGRDFGATHRCGGRVRGPPGYLPTGPGQVSAGVGPCLASRPQALAASVGPKALSDTPLPAPSAPSRTWGFPASGSSVVLPQETPSWQAYIWRQIVRHGAGTWVWARGSCASLSADLTGRKCGVWGERDCAGYRSLQPRTARRSFDVGD
jgi:hypothetical protein